MVWDKIGRVTQRIVDAMSALLFMLMFVMFILEIVFRYVFDDPLSWSMELIMVSFLVMLFFTGALGVPASRHISFNVVYAALPPSGRRIFTLVSDFVGLVVMVLAVPGIYAISVFQGAQSTPILHVPFSVFYFTFLLFVIAFSVRLALRMIGLLRPGWRERV